MTEEDVKDNKMWKESLGAFSLWQAADSCHQHEIEHLRSIAFGTVNTPFPCLCSLLVAMLLETASAHYKSNNILV